MQEIEKIKFDIQSLDVFENDQWLFNITENYILEKKEIHTHFLFYYIENISLFTEYHAKVSNQQSSFIEITYCIDGKSDMQFPLTDEFITLRSGQLCFNALDQYSLNVNQELYKFTGVSFQINKDFLFQVLGFEDECYSLKKDIDSIFEDDTCSIIEANQRVTSIINKLVQLRDVEKESVESLRVNKLCYDFLYEAFYLYFNKDNWELKTKKVIYLAREQLLEDLAHPPSIQELSLKNNISVSSLQNGFKRYFNNTIYGVLREEKMKKAHILLMMGHPVGHVASFLGYSNPSQFSKAFKKQYNCLPKNIKTTKK